MARLFVSYVNWYAPTQIVSKNSEAEEHQESNMRFQDDAMRGLT